MSIVLFDDFQRADTTSGLGTTADGKTWKSYASANFKITSGDALKATGTASVRYFALLPQAAIAGGFTISVPFRTNALANATDLGIAFFALDAVTTRGGQCYLSIRKTSTANSVRVLNRANTSGSDTVLFQSTAAGWTDDTEYQIDIVVGAPNGSGDRALTVKRNGTNLLTGTLTAAQLATWGTDVGISFTNTDTGSRIHSISVDDPAATTTDPVTPATPVATNMECIVHRGIEASAQAVTLEESVAGLETVLAKYPWINGVEVDARLSSDNVVYLFHDSTLAERLYPGATGSVESNTSTYLDGLGLTRLSTYLASNAAAKLKTIFVQFYVAWAPLTKAQTVVNVINASPLRSRVVAGVTGTENGYIDDLRTMWDGRIGLYGFDSSNVTTYKTALEASGGYMGFITPYDASYSANRSVVSTLHADGVKVGGSIIDTPSVMTTLNTDGADYVLTNEPGVYEDLFVAPANPSSKGYWVTKGGIELEFLGVWNGTTVVPTELLQP